MAIVRGNAVAISVAAVIAAAVLALVHLLAGNLRFLATVPRSRWLSAMSGVSVAYVFVHLLPELAETQEAVREAAEGTLPFIERHVYVIGLVGLSVFYGLELAARRSRRDRQKRGSEDETRGVFWVHIGSYAAYNALIGYLLLHRDEGTVRDLTLFALAIGMHFVVNDFGLREHHKDAYARIGRWILAAAVLVGVAIGAAIEFSEAAVGMLIAFLAGGVVTNVLKEELPEDRGSRFTAFAIGAGAYAALLLAL